MNSLKESRNQVLEQIEAACQRAGRESKTVQLLAVSKTHPSEALREMYATGQHKFGENYLQEALEKIDMCNGIRPNFWLKNFLGYMGLIA